MRKTILLLAIAVLSWPGDADSFLLLDDYALRSVPPPVFSLSKNNLRRGERRMQHPPLFRESYSYTAFADKTISSNPDRPDEGVIEQSTYLLLHDTNAGEWGEADFRRAETIIQGWSLRQSKRAALAVERLLRRIVREQEAENPYADCVDMTALYTNLVEGWAKCGEPGGAERAEEILDYFQRVYEDGDSYDPLLCGPGLESFNAVISAYARRGTDDAPQQAVRVLGKLYEWNGDGRTTVMPNKETYAYVLRAYAKQPTADAPELVRNLLRHMDSLSETYPSVKPDFICHNVYFFALTEAVNENRICAKDGCKLAKDHLETMLLSDDENVLPNKWSFNMVLTLISKSGAANLVQRAENLVRALEKYHAESAFSEKTQPNTNTYNALMICYARSDSRKKVSQAIAVLGRMRKMGVDNPSVRPDHVSYGIAMNLYAKSRMRDAPVKVEEILLEMSEAYNRTGDWRLKPNRRSINACLDAWTKSGLEGADDRIMDWIRNKHSDTVGRFNPDTWSYNHYLHALSKSGKLRKGEMAERVLEEVEKLYQQGHQSLKPNVLTFTNALHCIALSRQDDAVERALAILDRMEELHAQNYGDIRPNLFTYNCVINAIAKSKRLGKAQLAAQFLLRMEDVSLRPGIVSYNNVINACAFSSKTEDDPETVLQIAMDVLAKAQKGPGANRITYQGALRVVCCFEKNTERRFQLIRDIIRQCCEDGWLEHKALTQARFGVSEERYKKLMAKVTDPKSNRLLDKYTINARRSLREPDRPIS